MTSPLNFTPDAIRNDAAAMAALPMHAEVIQVLAPCALDSAASAASTLNRDAENLVDEQNQLTEERNRICDYMYEGASRYMGTVEATAEALNTTVGGGAGMSTAGSAPLTPPPRPNPFFPHLPRRSPTPPPAPTAPDGYSDVPTTETAISAPDTGTSLNAALAAWMANATTLQSTAAELPTAFTDWEGHAAEAASARIRALKAKVIALAEDWQALAAKGNGFLGAHTALKTSHHAVYEEYVALKAAWHEAYAARDLGALDAITKRLNQTQHESDEIRREYAQAAQLPPGPVPHGSGGESATADSAGRPKPPLGNRQQSSDGTSSAAGDSGAARSSTGAPSAATQPSSESPDANAAQTRPQSLPEGGEAKSSAQPPSGGASPGGLPSGGAPAGAGMPGGIPANVPGAGKPGPKPLSLPMRPADAGGGGKGAGGGGKGAGGGMGGRPLSPAAVAVGPTPAHHGAGPGPGTPDTGRAAVGGGSGGAGMPMMGHGAGDSQGKEKKRSAERSPDESVYTEDRPWTEGVVGHTRREVQGRPGPTYGSRPTQGRRGAEADHGSKDTT